MIGIYHLIYSLKLLHKIGTIITPTLEMKKEDLEGAGGEGGGRGDRDGEDM